MDDNETFEPGTHVFTGVVKSWGPAMGELVTDSGLSIFLATEGQPQVPAGSRVTVTSRKYRPRYQVAKVTPA